MATIQDAITYANQKVQGNGNISAVTGVAFYNEANTDFHLEMIKRGVEASQIQESYRDATVATPPNGSTFLYPDDMLSLKIITVNYWNTSQADYAEAQQIDVGNTQKNTAFEWLRVYQDMENPLWDDRGDWFELFPAFNATMNLVQAIRIFYYLKPPVYSAISDLIVYPESLDYYIHANKMVNLYLESIEKFDEAAYYQKVYLQRIERLVETLVRGEDKPIAANGLGMTGWQF